jgi:pimeloyl-ACP methyl ester carboxylesterase
VDVVDRLQEITVPTLVIVGELDAPAFHAMADAYVAGIHGAEKAVIRAAGHMCNMDDPGTFNEVVLRFLTERAKGSMR